MQVPSSRLTILAAMLAFSPSLTAADGAFSVRSFALDVHQFKVLGEDYDPENPGRKVTTYYRTIDDGEQSFIRALYLPDMDTVTLFREVPDQLRHGVRAMRWRWRAATLPRKGNECVGGLGDSAAAVYVTWKRGFRWYTLKFIWSSDAPLGATCNKLRNPLLASDSIVLRTGTVSDEWVEEVIDPEALFRQHFADGDARAEIPELQGIGVMTDGDQTHSISAADYAGFVLYK
jgi:hypothetical protein